MITILNIRNSNYPGGVETTLLGWNKEIDRSRFIYRLLIFQEKNNIHRRSADIMREQGLDSEVLPWGSFKNFPGAVYKLVNIIKKETNVILHSHDTRADLVALVAAKITGVPLIVSNHAWHAVGFKRWLLEAIRALLMRFVDLVINVSKDTHEETLRRGIPKQKSIYIYSGIDLQPFQEPPTKEEAREALGIKPNEFVVGDIARLWPEKSIDKLIDAAVQIVPAYPRLRIIIVGDGPLEDELKKYCTQSGMDSNISFLGFRKDLQTLYSAFDVFALPSAAEGTAMVIYSAMVMGLPIVASACSGVAEVLEDNKTALLIPPADSNALSRAIIKLIENPGLAQRLGEKAKKVVEEQYSAKQAIRKLEKIYSDFCERQIK